MNRLFLAFTATIASLHLYCHAAVIPIECDFQKGLQFQYSVESAVQNTPTIRAWLYQGTNWYTPSSANKYAFMFGRNVDTEGMVIITGVVTTAAYKNTTRACVDFNVTTNKFTQPVSKWYSVVLETNSSSKISFCHGYITIGKSPEINAYSALPYSKPIDGSLFGPFSGSFSSWPFMGSSHPAYNITAFDTQTWWAASGGGIFVVQQQLVDASNNLVAMMPLPVDTNATIIIATNKAIETMLPLIPSAVDTNALTNAAVQASRVWTNGLAGVTITNGFVTASITNPLSDRVSVLDTGKVSQAQGVALTNNLRNDIAAGINFSATPTVNGNAVSTNTGSGGGNGIDTNVVYRLSTNDAVQESVRLMPPIPPTIDTNTVYRLATNDAVTEAVRLMPPVADTSTVYRLATNNAVTEAVRLIPPAADTTTVYRLATNDAVQESMRLFPPETEPSWTAESNTVLVHVTDGHGINQWGGFNGGIGANGRAGGAIGKYAMSDTGGAIGSNAYTLMGGAIGTAATSTYGGAVGTYAIALAGGAVGSLSIAGNGFAGGYTAQTTNETGVIDAIQLGTGVNTNPHTLKVYDFPTIDPDGNIYLARQSNMLSVVDALAINPKYVTTEISAELGNEIVLNRRNFVTVNNSVDLDPRFEDADVDASWRLSILEESSTYALLQGYTDVYNDTNGVDPDSSFNAWYSTNRWYHNDMVVAGGGGALYFDGTDDYATNLFAYDWTNYTWCFWWKPDADETDAQLLMIGQGSAGISMNGNADLTHFQYPGSDLGLSGYQFVNNNHEFGFDGNWHFIAVSRDATLGENYLYYDGVTNGTFCGAWQGANAGPYLNCPPLKLASDGSIFAKGTFDEIVLFDRRLSKDEIDVLYNGGDGLYADPAVAPCDDGLIAIIHCDDAAGTVANDSVNGWSFVFGDGVSPTWTTGTKAMPTGDSYVTNMVIVSQPMGLPFIPSNVAVYACVRDVSITNFVTNTDALAFISCDGKTNWTPVTYSRESMLPNGDRKLFGIADVNSLSTNVYVMYRYTNSVPVRHKRSAVIGGK